MPAIRPTLYAAALLCLASIARPLAAQPTGACCLPNSTCQRLTSAACAMQNGGYAGDNVPCITPAGYSLAPVGGFPFGMFDDIRNSGTEIVQGDNTTVNIPIGFNFSFYGVVYTTVNVCSNGFVQFNGTDTAAANVAIPAAGAPRRAIFGLWDDLIFTPTNGAKCHYELRDTIIPGKRLVVQWTNVPKQDGAAGTMTFQITLHEGGLFTIIYRDIRAENPAGDYTIGVQDPTGEFAFQIPSSDVGGGNVAYISSNTPSINHCPPQPNDACANATAFQAGTQSFYTVSATPDGSASCGNSNTSGDVWFQWLPYTFFTQFNPNDLVTGRLRVDTCGSDFDTVLSAHTGCPADLPVPQEIVCNDNAVIGPCPGGTTSAIEFGITTDAPKRLRIGGVNNARGSGFLSADFAPDDQFVVQPANQNSTLIDFTGQIIQDTEFAAWARDMLVFPGINTPHVFDASFFFNTCFGGGMLDDLDTQLTARGVPWTGAAASRHDQPAFGQILPPLPPLVPNPRIHRVFPLSYWTEALEPNLFPQRTLSLSAEFARRLDTVGTYSNEPANSREDGQLVHRNRAGFQRLQNSPSRQYAVLWAGFADAERHLNNTIIMRNRLQLAWQDVPHTIYILYGDGVNSLVGDPTSAPVPPGWLPASKAQLQGVFGIIQQQITSADQFFFYATDHGGNTAIGGGGRVPGGGGIPGRFRPPMTPTTEGIVTAVKRESVFSPTLTIDYHGLSSNYADVFYENCVVGQLLPGQTTATFTLNRRNVDDSVDVEIANYSAGEFDIDHVTFYTGPISDGPPIDPANICLANFDGDSLVTVGDLFDFLAAWFAADPRADINGCGGLSVQDIFDFLQAYFAGC